MGEGAVGIVSAGAYTQALETPENARFVRDYDAAHGSWPSRYSECGWTAAALITAAAEQLRGDLANPARVRDALQNALALVKPPRGPMRFDAYRQAITPIYVTRTQEKDGRIANVVIDTPPAVTQEATWGWWNKG